MPQRQEDYFLRLIDELQQFVAEILNSRNPLRLDEALLAVVQAQEKLFGRPASEFRFPDVDAQLALLSQGESAAGAREKCLVYADLLDQAALIYEARHRPDFAASARQLAAHVRQSAGPPKPSC